MTNILESFRAHLLEAAGYTPGPWEVQRGSNGRWIVTAANGKTQIAGDITNEHDAHLIALLPDVVEAMQVDVADLCPHCGCHTEEGAYGVW